MDGKVTHIAHYSPGDIWLRCHQEYDGLLRELQALEDAHPSLRSADSPTQRVGGDITKDFPTVTHSVPMLSLANTYGQNTVAFVYAQPTAELVPGIDKPEIKDGMKLEFKEWPTSIQEIATQLGALAALKKNDPKTKLYISHPSGSVR